MAPSFVRAAVRDMSGYAPGEQPGRGERVVKLNTNENPFPPSDKVLRAIREIEEETLRRYPNPTAEGFRRAAAKVLGDGITPDMILAGNGSDDILTIATRTFVPPGGVLAFPDPTYSLYPVLTNLQDAHMATVPWGPDWSLPIDALIETGADAIYLANPNAPSGTFVSPTKVAELAAAFPGALLIDEAYVDFADDHCLSLVKNHRNVIVSRTLSKAYSLAGLRFGYGVAQADVIAEMLKVKDSYNCDAISILAATAAIEDQEYARSNWKAVRNERQRMSAALTAMGWAVLDSHANFILAGVPDGRGKQMYESLKRKHILVRHFDKPGLADKVRITIGLPYQNDALLAGITELSLDHGEAEADGDVKDKPLAASRSPRTVALKVATQPEARETLTKQKEARPTRQPTTQQDADHANKASGRSAAAQPNGNEGPRADGQALPANEGDKGRAVAGPRR